MKKAKKSEEDFDAKSAKSNAKSAKASSGGSCVSASAGENGGNVRVERVERVERNSRVEHKEHKELGSGERAPWPRARLGEVCEIIAGQSPKGCFYTSDSSFLEFHQGSKHFGDRELEVSGVYTKEVTKVVEPGTLLMSVRAPVGDLNVTPRRVCIGRGLAGLLPCERIDRDFLCFFLTSATKAIDKAAGAGACFSSISKDQLASLEIPLPPLSVQRAVVARLEGEMKAVGRLEAGFREMAKAAEAAFTAELAEAFAAGAGAGEAFDAKSAKGNAKNAKASSGGSCVSASEENSRVEHKEHKEPGEPWPRARLGEIAEIGYGYTAKTQPVSDSKPRYLRITDIKNDRVDWSSVPCCDCDSLAEFELHDGDIVFARTGATTGKSYLLKGDFPKSVFASYLIRVVINDQAQCLPSFLRYYFDTPEYWRVIQEGIAGAAQGGFNSKKLAALELPMPPLAVQRAIVSRLEAAAGRRARIVALAAEGAAAAADLRRAILKEAFEPT